MQYATVPKLAQFLVLLLLVTWAGCSSPSQPRTVTHLTEIQVEPAPAVGDHREDPFEPVPVATTPLTVPQPAPPDAVGHWVSYLHWSQHHGLQPYLVKGIAPSLTLEQNTVGGLLVLSVGNPYIRWNGVNLGLGFAPVWLRGEIKIHSIDIAKTLDPLINPSTPDARPMRILVLDPGHGGANFGTRSFNGSLVEKDLTLDWAQRVQRTLRQQSSNWTVLLTRTNDVELTGLQRVAFADAAQADLFISLHFNSVANNAIQAGLETYCTTPLGLPSNLTREFEDNLTHLYPNNQFDENNLYYALGLHRTLVRLTGCKDRGLRRARFMTVVREQTRPAVLIEGGYLSNPREARLIATPEFRQRLADAIVTALLELEGRVNLNGK